MTQYWYALKQELAKVNVYGWENTDILTVSERFFELANTTVSSAEIYSDELAKNLLRVEYAMAVTSLLLIALLLFNSFQNRRLSNKTPSSPIPLTWTSTQACPTRAAVRRCSIPPSP